MKLWQSSYKKRCKVQGEIEKRRVRSPRTPEGGQALKRNW
ncbi:hypothetical protein HMPREF1319_2234 [Capnocytophaga ochracea str. Holt 25]|nr:hypothetical protein HMPREF1319_2234 [Capnocytophaga ochracea str. Holt 25]